MSVFTLAAVLLWAGPAPSSLAEASSVVDRPDPLQLQADCLSYREDTTKHGHVFLYSDSEKGIGGPDPRRHESEMRFWFTTNRLRVDVRSRNDERKWGDWEHFVVDGETYIWIPEGEFEGVKAPVSEYASQPRGVMGHFALFHPKWLGIGENHESLMQFEPGARLVNPGATKARFEVEREAVNGRDLWRLTNPTSFPGATAEARRIPGEIIRWFDPEAGWSLVRGEVREHGAAFTKVRSVSVSLEKFPHDEVWFPREVVRETSYDGRVGARTLLKIQDAEFGRPPEDDIFALAGLRLLAGKRVADRTRGPREAVVVSDGEKMVPLKGPDVVEMPAPSYARRWLLTINAAVLAILAAAIALRAFRRKRR